MKIRKTKQAALIVCSGGVDSVTALYWARRREAFAVAGVEDETIYEK